MLKFNLNNIFKILIYIIILFYIKIYANDNAITIASTTSTHDTGLLKSINKSFYNVYKIKVNVISLEQVKLLELQKMEM